MTNPMDAYLAEFEQEAATTRRLIEAVPEEKWGFRANEKGMSIGEVCGHLATVAGGMPEVLGGEQFDIAQRTGPGPAPESRARALEEFDAGTRAAQAWMAGLGPKAAETWRLVNGEQTVATMPRAAAIRFFLLNHLYHHRGQLSAYLRASGAPVPSVYGPTADENPFA